MGFEEYIQRSYRIRCIHHPHVDAGDLGRESCEVVRCPSSSRFELILREKNNEHEKVHHCILRTGSSGDCASG